MVSVRKPKIRVADKEQVRRPLFDGRRRITSDAVFNHLVTNLLITRGTEGLGGLLLDQSGNRDIDSECQYPVALNINVYREFYTRVGLANRVVNVYPDECWSVKPKVYETEDLALTPFEKDWNQFLDKHRPWAALHKLDRCAGIGRFGVLLIGLDDGRPLDKPVRGVRDDGTKETRGRKSPRRNVLYLRPLAEDYVRVDTLEKDPYNPRFGQPKTYSVNLDGVGYQQGEYVYPAGSIVNTPVHWSRILHFADGTESNPWLGTPRLQPVVNMVYDCRKVLGGSAEMFWKGAFPGYSFETNPNLGDAVEMTDAEKEELKDEIDAFQNGLQRYLRLVNMSAKSLAPQVADPSKHMEQLLRLVAAATGVPIRILLGSEAGQLASELDTITWNRRLMLRNTDVLEPCLVRPLVERLILLGALPQPKQVIVGWQDLNTANDQDKADVALKLTQSLLQYVTSGACNLMTPLMYFQLILGYSEDEANALVKAAGGEKKVTASLNKLVKKAGGDQNPNTSGTNPTAKTGANGRRNGLGSGK